MCTRPSRFAVFESRAVPSPARRVAWGTALVWGLLATRAWAAAPQFTDARAMGIGDALRSAATGDAGPLLNPSGMALVRSYAAEAAYLFSSADNAHNGHASVVDSTSALGLSAGLAYTYTNSSPNARPHAQGHQGALALAVPLGERITFGGTLRYLRLTTDADESTGAAARKVSGFTFDVGATLRPSGNLSLGVVGYGLVDKKDPRAPLAVAGGASLSPVENLLLAFDAVLDFTTYDSSRGNQWSFMGGGEYSYARRFAVRAGGGHNAVTDNGYVSGGFSALSDGGALDFALRRDVSGPLPSTYVGVALRLFVGAPGS